MKKIKIRIGKVITRSQLFKAKEKFHRELSCLPFEEKIKILMHMGGIVECIGRHERNA